MRDLLGGVMAVNWKLREGRLTAELWEAVFLSQDIEPATPSDYGYPESLLVRTNERATDSQSEEFNRRVHIAYDHLITGRLAAVVRNQKEHESRVELTVFRLWAESLEKPWTFPEQFPRAAPIEAQREPISEDLVQSAPPRPLQRGRAQELAIFDAISQLNFNPLALPKAPRGKRGVRAAVRALLEGPNSMFPKGSRVFEKAWARMHAQGDIAYQ